MRGRGGKMRRKRGKMRGKRGKMCCNSSFSQMCCNSGEMRCDSSQMCCGCRAFCLNQLESLFWSNSPLLAAWPKEDKRDTPLLAAGLPLMNTDWLLRVAVRAVRPTSS